MTWVIGATTLFGDGVMISDVGVTIGGTREIDACRKVYPIAPNICAGFAGSVKIGFEMIRGLRAWLNNPPIESDEYWIPEWVAENWAPQAARLFDSHPLNERQAQCELMLMGSREDEGTTYRNHNFIAVLRSSNDFNPEIVDHINKCIAIGCGAQMQDHMDGLQHHFENDAIELMGAAEANNPGGYARTIAFDIARALYESKPQGVSKHIHCTLMRGRQIKTGPMNFDIDYPDGRHVEVRMPAVAESYSALCRLLHVPPDSTAIAACVHGVRDEA